MSDGIYDDVMSTESPRMESERVEMMVDFYESTDGLREQDFRTEKNTQQPLHNTGSDSVKTRSSRAALVCLVLLCFLLLTAVIVLCVFIYTNTTNYTQERNEKLTSITNITTEKDQLTLKDEQPTKDKNDILSNDYELKEGDGWRCFQSSCYFISSEKKNWTESRRDCREREADLIIINNREEQYLVRKLTNRYEVWIGLTDSDEEGRWTWVDGTDVNSGYWGFWEPNGNKKENCAVCHSSWADYPCDRTFQWMCEKHYNKNLTKH